MVILYELMMYAAHVFSVCHVRKYMYAATAYSTNQAHSITAVVQQLWRSQSKCNRRQLVIG